MNTEQIYHLDMGTQASRGESAANLKLLQTCSHCGVVKSDALFSGTRFPASGQTAVPHSFRAFTSVLKHTSHKHVDHLVLDVSADISLHVGW